MKITLVAVICASLATPEISCVKEMVTDSTQNEMTMQGCLGIEGNGLGGELRPQASDLLQDETRRMALPLRPVHVPCGYLGNCPRQVRGHCLSRRPNSA
jgi:hypothetical protein